MSFYNNLIIYCIDRPQYKWGCEYFECDVIIIIDSV